MGNLFNELKRRNVVRVGIAYIVLGWVALQVADILFDLFEAPTWVGKTFAAFLLLGFPFACLFAWAFEVTPQGVKRTAEVDRDQSITHSTGRKLDFVIIAALVVALGYFIWERQAHDVAPDDAIADKSIAVLPFVNMSSDEEQEWFADGLTEEILNSLARTPDLLVASRTSSFQFKGQTPDISKIAATLGVGHILEGSVRRGGDRLRVTAQLIRASDGFHLWSETFDREPKDVIEIQENVAIEIANALETAMDPGALEKMVSAGTASVAAYEAYLEGLAHQNVSAATGNLESWDKARDAFGRATAIDSEFALAHWQRALFWQTQLNITSIGAEVSGLPAEQTMANYRAAIEAAIEHEDDATIRHKLQANKALNEMRYREAQRHLEQYLEHYTNDMRAYTDLMNIFTSMRDSAGAAAYAAQAEQAMADDPFSLNGLINNLLFVGLAGDAARVADEAVLRYPQHAFLVYQAHRALLWNGDIDKSRLLVEVLRGKEFPEENIKLVQLRQACAEGDIAAAEILLEEANGLRQGDSSIAYISRQIIGRPGEAHQVLIDAQLDTRSLSSFLTYGYFDHTQFPQLAAMLEKQGIDRPFISGPPYACNQ